MVNLENKKPVLIIIAGPMVQEKLRLPIKFLNMIGLKTVSILTLI